MTSGRHQWPNYQAPTSPSPPAIRSHPKPSIGCTALTCPPGLTPSSLVQPQARRSSARSPMAETLEAQVASSTTPSVVGNSTYECGVARWFHYRHFHSPWPPPSPPPSSTRSSRHGRAGQARGGRAHDFVLLAEAFPGRGGPWRALPRRRPPSLRPPRPAPAGSCCFQYVYVEKKKKNREQGSISLFCSFFPPMNRFLAQLASSSQAAHQWPSEAQWRAVSAH